MFYEKCCSHFLILSCQRSAYMNFKEELSLRRFGFRMEKQIHQGHLFVIDFVQLDPATSRHKDCVIHVYGPPITLDDNAVTSHAFHYIGGDNSVQPNNTSFAMNALSEVMKAVDVSNDTLLVIFSDNGPKEFNSSLMSWLPKLQKEVNIGTEKRKKIVYNFFCENHGGSACDGDGNNARRALNVFQRDNSVLLESTSSIVSVVNNMNNTDAIDASNFPTLSTKTDLDFRGINSYYCFQMNEQDELIGYSDSWNLGNERNFSHPFQPVSKQQSLLQGQINAGIDIHKCESCGTLFKHAHTCTNKRRRKKNSVREKSSESDELSALDIELHLDYSAAKNVNKRPPDNSVDMRPRKQSKVKYGVGSKVDVFHKDELWYCGKVTDVAKKTRRVVFEDLDCGQRVKLDDIRECVHDPQVVYGTK